MKLIFNLIKLTILIVIVSLIFHDIAGKFYLNAFLRWSLGVPVETEKVHINLKEAQAEVRGLRLGNPAGFPDGTLVYIPKIFIDLDPFALLRSQIHIEELAIDCDDIRIVRDEDGDVNWLSLKPLKAKKSASQTQTGSASRGDSAAFFALDKLVLSLGAVSYVDLYAGIQKSMNLGVRDVLFENVNSFQDLIRIIVWETIKRVGIGQITEAFKGLGEKSKATGILEKAFKGVKLKF